MDRDEEQWREFGSLFGWSFKGFAVLRDGAIFVTGPAFVDQVVVSERERDAILDRLVLANGSGDDFYRAAWKAEADGLRAEVERLNRVVAALREG